MASLKPFCISIEQVVLTVMFTQCSGTSCLSVCLFNLLSNLCIRKLMFLLCICVCGHVHLVFID